MSEKLLAHAVRPAGNWGEFVNLSGEVQTKLRRDSPALWNSAGITALNMNTYVSRIVHLSCDPIRAGGQWLRPKSGAARAACETLLATTNFLHSSHRHLKPSWSQY